MEKKKFMWGHGTLLVVVINIEAEKGKPYKHFLTLEDENGNEIKKGYDSNYSNLATIEFDNKIVGHCTHNYLGYFPECVPFEIKPLIEKGNN